MQRTGVSDRAFRELAGVNQAFLDLLTMENAGEEGAVQFGLGAGIVHRIRLLDERCLERIARRPFPLFSLRFDDRNSWAAVLARGVRDDAAGLSWPVDGGRVQQFLVMAIAAIRAVAAREPVSASVLFGVPASLSADLARTEIRALPAVAEAVSPWLQAKCATMSDWWSGMILFACGASTDTSATHRGIHSSLVSALNLRRARVPEGRLYRRR
jgi:hypothetical protein